MINKNEKISALQLGILGKFLGTSILLGIANSNMVFLGRQDVWLISLFSLGPGLILMLMLIYIINYKPNDVIFAKIDSLFGKRLGILINFIMCIFILIIIMVVSFGIVDLTNDHYLSNTPRLALLIFFYIPVLYGVIKGIETIVRSSFVLFGIAMFLIIIIIISLIPYSNISMIHPILANGFSEIVKKSMIFLSYSFLPLITLSVVPKNNIIDNKYYSYYLIGGYFISIFLMTIFYFFLISVVGPDLGTFYTYPFHYLEEKISITPRIDKLESFLSLNMLFNMFMMMIMGIYFISKYIEYQFKIKKKIYNNYIISTTGIITIILINKFFINAIIVLEFVRVYFPVFVGLMFFIILLITVILISLKPKNKTT